MKKIYFTFIAAVFVMGIFLCYASAQNPKRWSDDVLDYGKAWYSSANAKSLADSVIQYQSPEGGWPKSTNLAEPPSTPGDIPKEGDGRANSFDNEATILPMEFLARVIHGTNEGRYKKAFNRGLDYIHAAQYSNGGWPQFWPLRGDKYYSRITFNDGAIIRVMNLLHGVALGEEPFAFVDAERRVKAKDAVKLGIDCILKTQIKQNGNLTAWCAQHDEKTLKPAWARAYEPPSLSGSESVGVVRFLMSMDDPTPAIINAVEGAVSWFQKASMKGVRQERVRNSDGRTERILVDDPEAPLLWARFYELVTNRPLYVDRDSVYRYDFSEISYERRSGYSYNGTWAASLLEKDYPKWRQKHIATAAASSTNRSIPSSDSAKSNNSPDYTKPRIINTTDLGADPDDEQSMVRQLVCANEFDIEGLIVSTGCWKQSQSNTDMLDKILNAYKKVESNLRVHAEGYPSYEYLKSITVMGNTGYGMADVGEGKDSPGSELIIAAVDKDDPRPVWLTGWGGVNTIAQAIWKVNETRSDEEVSKFLSKIRVFDILGQDDAGAWLAKNFPELFYIRATGVYGWQPSDDYLDEHIQNHGPLGKVYPDRKWATEGDTPAFMHVYPNGLNDPDEIDQGGWGGRFSFDKKEGIRSMSGVKKETETKYDPYYMYGNTSEGTKAIKRWSKGYNNDFAARMDWSVTSNYEDANHHPIAVVNGDTTRQVMEIAAAPGSSITLNTDGSSDPDGDSLNYSWSFYNEPSSYDGKVKIQNSSSSTTTVEIPSDASSKDIHIILELYDNGSPNLYAYRRIIINVE